MGFPRRSRGGFPGRRSRRLTSWQVGPGGTAVTTFTDTISALLGSFSVALEDGLTIVRIRGELLVSLRSTAAATGGFSGAFGIGKATADALGVGVTAVPNPIDDEDWDGWLYHRYFAVGSPSAVAGGAALDDDMMLPTSGALRLEIDSKAMRKVPENEAIFASVQVVEVGPAVMDVWFNSRMLAKLP